MEKSWFYMLHRCHISEVTFLRESTKRVKRIIPMIDDIQSRVGGVGLKFYSMKDILFLYFRQTCTDFRFEANSWEWIFIL